MENTHITDNLEFKEHVDNLMGNGTPSNDIQSNSELVIIKNGGPIILDSTI